MLVAAKVAHFKKIENWGTGGGRRLGEARCFFFFFFFFFSLLWDAACIDSKKTLVIVLTLILYSLIDPPYNYH